MVPPFQRISINGKCNIYYQNVRFLLAKRGLVKGVSSSKVAQKGPLAWPPPSREFPSMKNAIFSILPNIKKTMAPISPFSENHFLGTHVFLVAKRGLIKGVSSSKVAQKGRFLAKKTNNSYRRFELNPPKEFRKNNHIFALTGLRR